MEGNQLPFNEKERRFLLSLAFNKESTRLVDILATWPSHTQVDRAVKKAINLLCEYIKEEYSDQFIEFSIKCFYQEAKQSLNEAKRKGNEAILNDFEDWETPIFANWEPKKLGDLAKELGQDMEKVRRDLLGKPKIEIEFNTDLLEEGRKSWQDLKKKLDAIEKDRSFMTVKESEEPKPPKIKLINGLAELAELPFFATCTKDEARAEQHWERLRKYSVGGYTPFLHPQNHCGWEPQGEIDFTKMFWENDWIYLTYSQTNSNGN